MNLLGRAKDIQILDGHRGNARILTVLGPGGVGKTRLAEHCAKVWSDRGEEANVFFCDLAEAGNLEEIEHVVAAAAGIDVSSGDALDRLTDALSGRGRVLVIVDNVERVTSPLMVLMDRCLAETDETWFLVPSRMPLGHPEEVCHELEPLTLEDGIALFVAQVKALGSDLRPNGDELEVISKLVQRLDCLPLAIELAAARIPLMSSAQLLARVEKSLDVLRDASGPSSGRGARQTSLRRVIQDSWDFLDSVAQTALAQCVVFRGSFELDDAERILELPANASVEDALGRLRAQSLLCVTTDGTSDARRLGLLESIRTFASERLDELGMRSATEERHARHFADKWLNDASTPAAAVDFQNLMAAFSVLLQTDPERAVRVALALDAVLAALGPLDLHRDVLSRARVAAEKSARVSLRAEVALAIAECAILSGINADARQAAAAAHAIALEANDGALEGRALAKVGRAIRDASEDPEATWRAALDRMRANGPNVKPDVLGAEASLLTELGYFVGDLEMLLDSISVAERAADPRRRTNALCHVAVLEAELGRATEARAHALEVLAIARVLTDPRSKSPLLTHGGSALWAAGEEAVAEQALRDALAIDCSSGNVGNEFMSRSLLWFANADCDEDPILEARRWIYRSRWTPWYQGVMTGQLAGALARHGDALETREALASAQEFVTAVKVNPNLVLAMECMAAIAELFLARRFGGNVDSARSAASEIIETVDRLTPAGARARFRSIELVFARRSLGRALLQFAPHAANDEVRDSEPRKETDPHTIVLGVGCSWFSVDGEKRVDLARRKLLRDLLTALVERRKEGDNAVVQTDELLSRLWPNDRARSALPNRLYNAIAQLRSAGLHDVVLRRGEGYLINPAKVLRTPEGAVF